MRTFLIAALLVIAAPAAAQDWAVDRLDESPRHHEWAEVDYDGRTVHSFVTYPERDEAVPAVVVIHENRGLTDWVRLFADRLAAEGYITIAPDLLSGFDEAHDRTSDFESSDAARSAIYELEGAQVIADLHAIRDHVAGLSASTGTVSVAGFCWGGSRSFEFATYSDEIAAAFVFYGTPPDDERLSEISTPVYGFYGESDERVNATIEPTAETMSELGLAYEYEIYDGVGHAFMRQGADPDADQTARQAREAAFDRLTNLLGSL